MELRHQQKHSKLLGVEIDNMLKFNGNVEALSQKVNKKTSAFARLNIYIYREQGLLLCNVVILSNFHYCPLICVFCNKSANKKIDGTVNMIHRSTRYYSVATATQFT